MISFHSFLHQLLLAFSYVFVNAFFIRRFGSQLLVQRRVRLALWDQKMLYDGGPDLSKKILI